jgi:hypothetical protein
MYGNKYSAKKSQCMHGHTHDSRKEAQRCDELHLLQRTGMIKDLEIQRKFVLVPSMKYSNMPNERECAYVADFCYKENDTLVVEDTKGYRTKDYIIKRKLFKQKYCHNGDTVFREI